MRHRRRVLLFLRDVRDQCLGRQQERGNGRRVLQRHALDLRRVDDARLQHVHKLHGLGVEAPGGHRLGLDLLDHDAALEARVLDDLADRLLERPLDDLRAYLLVALDLQPVDGLGRAEQRDAAARYDALLHRRAGRIERILHPRLLFLHRRLGRGTDLDHRHAAGELGQALLQLLPVVVRGRLLDLRPNLLDAPSIVEALPAPSTIVVLSLSTTTFLARPRSSSLMFSSLIPRSSVRALPPVRTAMSSSMTLRRSPKPGAFTAQPESVPRSLLTTSVASASPSTSSAMMSRGLPARATCSSSGSMSFITLIFFSWIRT